MGALWKGKKQRDYLCTNTQTFSNRDELQGLEISNQIVSFVGGRNRNIIGSFTVERIGLYVRIRATESYKIVHSPRSLKAQVTWNRFLKIMKLTVFKRDSQENV